MGFVEKLKAFKYLRHVSAGLVLLSLFGMAMLFKFYSTDANSIHDPVVQSIGVGAALIFFIGISFAFLSKPAKLISAVAAKGTDTRVLAGNERAKINSSQTMPKTGEGVTEGTARTPDAPANAAAEPLSFEEEMARKKRGYYASISSVQTASSTVQIESKESEHMPVQVKQPVPVVAEHKSVFPKIPFGKPSEKKKDPLRELLKEEQENADRSEQWKLKQ